MDLSGRINACRTGQQKAEPFKPESAQLLALAAYIGLQSRGMPVAPPDDPRLASFRARGRGAMERPHRPAQLLLRAMSRRQLGPQARLRADPAGPSQRLSDLRLDWQGMGSLQRRFRNCMSGVRAEAYPYGAPEFIDLELFLMDRARGMPMETPGVRP